MYKSLILIMLLAVAGSMSAQTYGAEMPQAGFTSTGTMMGSGSAYSSTPTISDNGTAGDPYSATPSRVGARGYTPPGTPDEEEEEPEFIPIGEPLVMLFFAAAAAAVVALRRRKVQA
ncbi:MAG: hypothetical protein MJZ55_01225 [Paludibacteraceae bacterium]|nr:hypothetical protein [Paludibacteraceae bacterium]